MRIFCPACSTEYEANDSEIPDDGRDVQCTVCQHGWHFVKNPNIQKNQSSKNTPFASSANEDEDVKESMPSIFIQFLKKITEDPRLQFVAAWLFLFTVIGGISYTGSVQYEALIRRHPQLAKIANFMFQNSKENLFAGFELTKPRIHSEFISGKRVLVIEGDIQNTSDTSLTIPVMRASLLNSQGQEIIVWNIQYPEDIIAANTMVTYNSRMEDPPIDSESFLITFITATEALLSEDSVQAEIIISDIIPDDVTEETP